MPDNTIDGTPDAVKVACPVWSGGKSCDYFKGLPITIERIDATYRNEDEYIRRCTTFHTYAVVTPDGEWHAVGEMGWFGFSSESPAVRRKWEQEYHKRFLEPAQENHWYMVIVDCHI